MSNDKRMTLHQSVEMMHDYYDDLETASLGAAQRALAVEFGFGPERWKRFKEKYLEMLGEEAEKLTEQMRRKVKKRMGVK